VQAKDIDKNVSASMLIMFADRKASSKRLQTLGDGGADDYKHTPYNLLFPGTSCSILGHTEQEIDGR